MTGPFGERISALLREVIRSGEPVLGMELSGERPGHPASSTTGRCPTSRCARATARWSASPPSRRT